MPECRQSGVTVIAKVVTDEPGVAIRISMPWNINVFEENGLPRQCAHWLAMTYFGVCLHLEPGGRGFPRPPGSAWQKSPLGDFFDCVSPPSILAIHKMLFSKSLVFQGFSSGGLLYSRRALPPRAPPLLCHLTLQRGSLTVRARRTRFPASSGFRNKAFNRPARCPRRTGPRCPGRCGSRWWFPRS